MEADARRKYRWAIDIFEKYRRQFPFDEKLEYKLGFLYDHLAIFKTAKLRKRKQRRELIDRYLKTARIIYQGILRKNPRYALAWHGLSRVYQMRGDYRKAISYELKAYKLLRKRPKSKRGILGIGNIYLQKGDYKMAEYWFEKELLDLGRNNLGANANLMKFYIETKNYKEALPYALRTEQLLKKELGGSFYKKADRNNKTIKLLKRQIEEIKRLSIIPVTAPVARETLSHISPALSSL